MNILKILETSFSGSLLFISFSLSISLSLLSSSLRCRSQMMPTSAISSKHCTSRSQPAGSCMGSALRRGHWYRISWLRRLYMLINSNMRTEVSRRRLFQVSTRNLLLLSIFDIATACTTCITIIISMLVLPTAQVPPQLQEFINQSTPVQRRMLNGYRNRLTHNLRWTLTADDGYCGLGFCYQLKPEQAEDNAQADWIKQYENEVDKIEVVQNAYSSYVLVAKDKAAVYRPEDGKIGSEKLRELIGAIGDGEYEEVSKSVLLSSFNTIEEAKASEIWELLSNQQDKQSVQALESQQNYYGANLFQVPQFDAQTGEWSSQQTLTLKINPTKQSTV